MSRPWVATVFSPGPQPTFTSSQGDDPDFPPPPPVGFITKPAETAADTNTPRLTVRRISRRWQPPLLTWEGDNT